MTVGIDTASKAKRSDVHPEISSTEPTSSLLQQYMNDQDADPEETPLKLQASAIQ